MVTTLMSKSKLKTFGFASNLSKMTSLLGDIEKPLPPVDERPAVVKRPREASDEVQSTGKKRCVESAPKPSQPPPPLPPPPPPSVELKLNKPKKSVFIF